MDPRWLIVADDLTAAADSAIAFARHGMAARVTWGEPRVDAAGGDVAVAFDADTRSWAAVDAANRHREILQRLFVPGMRVFKKIDSTLRGHPAEEIGALIGVLAVRAPRLRAVFAPAFPAGGRVTRGGRVFVHGVPLEQTEFWNPARPAACADLTALLETAGLRARRIPLDAVRGDALRLRAELDAVATGTATVCVCDAEVPADLERIAAAALDATNTFFAGSAGLAHALASHAARAGGPRAARIESVASGHGALLVVGSQAGPTRAALPPLAAISGIRRVTVTARALLCAHGPDAALPMIELRRALLEGIDVVVDVAPAGVAAHAPAPDVVRALARVLAPLAADAGALMATGGDTAAALLPACGIHGIRLVDELEPGASLGLTLGALALPIVTKSGGFGDAGSLRRIVERLRSIRQTGTLA
jgi:uncharacterized protein YgbK (DUF1537 family)